MDVLGDVVVELAERGGLRVRIVHDEPSPTTPRLLMVIDDVEDVSANVIFGSPDVARATGYVTGYGYTIENPQVTDAIAFSAGELASREATRLSDAAALALWGDRTEVLVDQRQTDDVDEITDALEERLAEGATPTSVEFTVAPGGDAQFRRDYDVGYRVGVELPDLPEEVSDNTIREANTKVEFEQPERVSLVVGTPGAQSASTKRAARLNKALKRIAMIERSR
jgi:acyl-CoA synthetase (AMP-forming)/AMP-acid ligase II